MLGGQAMESPGTGAKGGLEGDRRGTQEGELEGDRRGDKKKGGKPQSLRLTSLHL